MEQLRLRLGTITEECGGGSVYDFLCPILLKHKALIAGGIVLQSIIGETWESSDVDIYVTEENFESLIADFAPLKQIFTFIDSSNYHNSFMKKNNVLYLGSSFIPITEHNIIEHKPIQLTNELFGSCHTGFDIRAYGTAIPNIIKFFDFSDPSTISAISRNLKRRMCNSNIGDSAELKLSGNNLSVQIICIKSGVPLRHVIGTYDLTFCQVCFDGKKIETCGETKMKDVLSKTGKLSKDYYEMYNHILYKRISKYKKRGFKIDIDYRLLASKMRPRENNIEMLLNAFLCLDFFSLTPDRISDFKIVRDNTIVENLFSKYDNIVTIIDEFPQIMPLIPEFIHKLNLQHTHRLIVEEIFNLPRIDYINRIPIPIPRNKIPGDIDSLFDSKNKEADLLVKKMRADGTLKPSPDCLLIGASAIAMLRGYECKPTYLIKIPFYFLNSNSKYQKVFQDSTNSDIYYTQYEDCNVFLSEHTTKFTASIWPCLNAYFDGTYWMISTELTTSKTFSINLGWYLFLRKSDFLTNEIKTMCELGYTIDEKIGCTLKNSRLTLLTNIDGRMLQETDIIKEIYSDDGDDEICNHLVKLGYDITCEFYDSLSKDFQQFEQWFGPDALSAINDYDHKTFNELYYAIHHCGQLAEL
jgi:hypothetical protein